MAEIAALKQKLEVAKGALKSVHDTTIECFNPPSGKKNDLWDRYTLAIKSAREALSKIESGGKG